jgi:hypothetical protein
MALDVFESMSFRDPDTVGAELKEFEERFSRSQFFRRFFDNFGEFEADQGYGFFPRLVDLAELVVCVCGETIYREKRQLPVEELDTWDSRPTSVMEERAQAYRRASEILADEPYGQPRCSDLSKDLRTLALRAEYDLEGRQQIENARHHKVAGKPKTPLRRLADMVETILRECEPNYRTYIAVTLALEFLEPLDAPEKRRAELTAQVTEMLKAPRRIAKHRD